MTNRSPTRNPVKLGKQWKRALPSITETWSDSSSVQRRSIMNQTTMIKGWKKKNTEKTFRFVTHTPRPFHGELQRKSIKRADGPVNRFRSTGRIAIRPAIITPVISSPFCCCRCCCCRCCCFQPARRFLVPWPAIEPPTNRNSRSSAVAIKESIQRGAYPFLQNSIEEIVLMSTYSNDFFSSTRVFKRFAGKRLSDCWTF